ncbi:tRNA (N6-threonylcarbamoyladenosine(37)-N6)-methyltransferase TrmO [bacterium]|nr:tRNA (N6-threonylcarbamoyladenosine(37)-N6)-methyltransferase TrmO [bacterium]
MKTAIPLVALVLGFSLCVIACQKGASVSDEGKKKFFKLWPVGKVKKSGGVTTIEIDPAYRKALVGLKDFSHIHVLYWFDKNDTPQKRAILQVHPRGNRKNPLTGVFATRSPVRPNLIALSQCRIISIKDCTIRIESIDAFDDSPVIDIKPYVPGSDLIPEAEVPGWVGW